MLQYKGGVHHLELTPEVIQRLKDSVGKPGSGSVPPLNRRASKDAIRHFAFGIGDDNPLWYDEAYVLGTPHGGIIAPPLFPASCGSQFFFAVVGLPDVHTLDLEDTWHMTRPLAVGEQVDCEERLVEVQEVEYGNGPGLLLTSEAMFPDQGGALVARWTNRRRVAAGEAAWGSTDYEEIPPSYYYTAEELDVIEAAVEAEERRGDLPRWWGQVQKEDTLVPVVKGPLMVTDLIAWHMGYGAPFVKAHLVAFRLRREFPNLACPDPKLGIPDTPVRIHWDWELAQTLDLPRPCDLGPQRTTWLGHLLTNWAGDTGWITSLHVEYLRLNFVRDTVWCRGRVTGKEVRGQEHLVTIEVWCENQRGEVSARGSATVRVPAQA